MVLTEQTHVKARYVVTLDEPGLCRDAEAAAKEAFGENHDGMKIGDVVSHESGVDGDKVEYMVTIWGNFHDDELW